MNLYDYLVSLYAKDGMVWMNQNQLAQLFDTSKQNIGQHIANILKDGELDENSVVKNFFTTASDGKDYQVTFYSLEHLYPFSEHLKDMLRVLKPGGKIVGAIPAEGGLAWGLGRFLTSRRWLRKNTSVNPDKIICWEHPSMADEILSSLSEHLYLDKIAYWPLGLPVIDLSLILRFIFSKPL